MRLFLGISVVSMLACAGGVKEKEEDPADDTAASADDSGGGGGGGGGGLFGPCSDYGLAYGEGTEWVYDYEFQTQSGVTTNTIVEQSGGQLKIKSVSEWVIPQFDSYVTTSFTYYNCSSKGLVLNTIDSTTVYVYGGQEQETWSQTTYEDGYLVVPADLKVGSTWAAEGTGTSTTEAGDTEFDYAYDCEIKKKEDVEVEAGSFSTLKQVCESSDGTQFVAWMAKDVGTVKTETTELVSFSN